MKTRTPDGSVAAAIPDIPGLREGATGARAVDSGPLVVDPKPRPRYTMAELLARSDYSEPLTDEDREWLDAPPVGRELL